MYKAGAGHKGSSFHLDRIYTEDVTIHITGGTRAMDRDTVCKEKNTQGHAVRGKESSSTEQYDAAWSHEAGPVSAPMWIISLFNI